MSAGQTRGHQTLGPYDVEGVIAEGGMGAVYRAKNRATGEPCALKVLRPELAAHPALVERFVREATIAAAVRHAHLVQSLPPQREAGVIYQPMELLSGETLGARLARVKRMSAADTAAILSAVCEALQLLHDQGFVHRDLKPASIFLAQVGGHEVPKVIDLGSARDLGDPALVRADADARTSFAPEQAEGRRDVDGRADQYALGVVAYQMVTGALPYESDDPAAVRAKLMRGEAYVPASQAFADVPPNVEAAITRAMSHEREQRFPRIVDFGRALSIAASGMDSARTVMDLGDAVEQAKAVIAARPVLTVGAGAETQLASPVAAPPPAAAPVAAPAAAFAAPPSASARPASSSRVGIVVAVVIAIIAIVAVAAAGGLWWMQQRQAGALQPRAVELGPAPAPAQ